jgi:hypothetical protein
VYAIACEVLTEFTVAEVCTPDKANSTAAVDSTELILAVVCTPDSVYAIACEVLTEFTVAVEFTPNVWNENSGGDKLPREPVAALLTSEMLTACVAVIDWRFVVAKVEDNATERS